MNSNLLNQLKKYSAISAGSLAFKSLNAQVVSNTIEEYISINDLYKIDLDNDGIFDFAFTGKNSSYYWSVSRCMYGIGLNGSFVASSNIKNASIYSYTSISYVNFLSKLNESTSTLICGNNHFERNGMFFNFWANGGGYASGNSWSALVSGNWDPTNESYALLGVKFDIGGNNHYGWLRVRFSYNGSGFYIKDYAYDAIPNKCVSGPTPLVNIEYHKKISFALFPNPSKDLVKIESEQELKTIEIRDVSGKLILTSISNNLDVSTLSNGIYTVKVEFKTGDFSFEKLIVNK